MTKLNKESFSGLHLLKRLGLYDNKLHKLEYNVFKHLKSLDDINLHYNHLKEINSLHFNTKRIINLRISYNRINKCTLSHLKLMKCINLHGNKLTNINKTMFVGLINLIDLHLGENTIQEIDQGLLEI